MPLHRRLFLFVFVPVTLLYYAFGIYGVFQARAKLIDDLDQDLIVTTDNLSVLLGELTTEEIASLLAQSGTGAPRLSVLVDIETGETVLSPATRDGAVQAPPADEVFRPLELATKLDEPFTTESRDGNLRYRTIATRVGDGRLIVVAEPLDRIDRLARRLFVGAALLGLMILAAMAVVVYIAIRSGLRPLARFVATTVRVADGDLSERVEPDQNEPGFAEIARATNHMLDQVEAGYEQQRIGRQRLNELVAGAAHELRTPLTAIRGTVEMRHMGAIDSDEKLRAAFDGIDAYSSRMVDIVEDLIVIARAENLRLGLHDQASTIVDVAKLLESQVRSLQQRHPDRVIEFDATGDRRPAPVNAEVAGDEALLATAFGHLLENAVLHTPPETRVRVRLDTTDDSIQVEVADTGPGVPEAIRETIFDRFVRADPSRARATGGAGLGLSIVHSVTEAAGGTVRLVETGEPGCTFVVELPRRSHRSPAARPSQQPADR